MNGGFTIPQSAVLPYRMVGNGMEILLVTSRTRGRWVLPKGMITPGMTPAESAAKEAWEEAGIAGSVSRECLGVYRYNKARRCGVKACSVNVYAMKVTAVFPKWPEQRLRRRRWMRVDEAICSVMDRDLKRLLITVRTRLRSPLLPFRNVATHKVSGHMYASHSGRDDNVSSIGAFRQVCRPSDQGRWRAGNQERLTAMPPPKAGNGCAAIWHEGRRPGGRAGRSNR
jgi:8-oxo-dGTP pyrophosphatase MutT (NUDIX family)